MLLSHQSAIVAVLLFDYFNVEGGVLSHNTWGEGADVLHDYSSRRKVYRSSPESRRFDYFVS